jgi:photosystem II stability/assembly factor-like uncharacterized protein
MMQRIKLRFMVSHAACAFMFATLAAHAQNFWTPTSGPPKAHVLTLAANSSGHIFAGLEGNGIYVSTDQGASWIPKSAGLTNTFIYAVAVSPNGYVFCGTSGSGVFRSTDNGASWAGS